MKFTRLLVPAIFALSSQSFVAQIALSQDLPNPDQLYIKSISALGTGCPASSYSANLSDDGRAFTLTFSEFVAEIGPGIPLSSARKNCSVTLGINVPAGWQYSIGTFNYRGFMDVADKVQAEHTTSYFFQGTGETGTFTANVRGPIAQDFVYTDKVGLTSVFIPDTWSPCNTERALTINPSIRLTKLAGAPADVQSIITNDSADGELHQVFGLKWRKCGQTPTPPTTPTTPTTPAPTGLKAGAVYNLVSRHSGQCFDVRDHSNDNGAKLQQWYCTSEDHQKFRLVDRGQGLFSLVGLQSGKTVSVESSQTQNGATILQWDDQNNPNQKLTISNSANGSYTVRFQHSNKCLDVDGAQTNTPGAKVQQWDCLNVDNQDWFFRPAKDQLQDGGEYTFVSRKSGKCLDVADHSVNNGGLLQQWDCTGEAHQKFRVINNLEGKYTLIGVQSGKAVSVESSKQDNGAAVIQWDDYRSDNQKVTLTPSTDGSYSLHFLHSKKCLNIADPTGNNGSKANQWDCTGNDNQDFYIRK